MLIFNLINGTNGNPDLDKKPAVSLFLRKYTRVEFIHKFTYVTIPTQKCLLTRMMPRRVTLFMYTYV